MKGDTCILLIKCSDFTRKVYQTCFLANSRAHPYPSTSILGLICGRSSHGLHNDALPWMYDSGSDKELRDSFWVGRDAEKVGAIPANGLRG